MRLFNTFCFILNHPLNRKNKIQATWRFVKWQVGSRLMPGDVIYEWVNEVKFFVRPGETGLTGNIYTGLHEFEDMAFLLHYLGPKDLFVDVGANVGSYTLLACGVKGARGLAIEPIPTTFFRLSQNIRLNHLENRVEIINMGVGSKKGRLFFTTMNDTTNHVQHEKNNSENLIKANVLTLDNIASNKKPVAMKIDVEGYEVPVLKGAKKILRSPTLKIIVIEMNESGNRYGFDEKEIISRMNFNGFLPYRYDPFKRTLNALKGKNAGANNTLFIRDVESVRKKVNKSEAFKILGTNV